MRRFHLLLVLLLPFLQLAAQDPYAQVINTGNGLPGNAVYHMMQDSKGFMWFTTDEGISRYDGHSFKTYYSPDQSSKPGSQLHEDRYGRTWYENFDGFLYYIEHDTLKKLAGTDPLGYVHFGIVNDRLLTFERNGVLMFDLRTLAPLQKVPVKGPEFFITAHQSDQHYYVITNSIQEISETGESRTMAFPAFSGAIKNLNAITAEDGSMYIALQQGEKYGLYHLTDRRMQLQFSFPLHSYIQATFYTDSCFWFCTSRGVYAYYADGRPRNGGKPYFEDKSISGVLKDREGAFWFTTTTEGVLFVPDIRRQLVCSGCKPFRLLQFNDSLFIGSRQDEIYSYNQRDGDIRLLRKGTVNHEINYLFGDQRSGNVYYNSGYNIVAIDSKGKTVLDKIFAVKSMCRVDDKYIALAATGSCCLYATDTTLKSEWDQWPLSTGREFVSRDVLVVVRGKAACFNPRANLLYFATNVGLFAATPGGKQEVKLDGKSLYLLDLCYFNNAIYGYDARGLLYEINGHTVTRVLEDVFADKKPVRLLKSTGGLLFISTTDELFYTGAVQQAGQLRKSEISIHSLAITDIELWQNELLLATDRGLLRSDFRTNQVTRISPVFVLNGMQVNNRPVDFRQAPAFDYERNNIDLNYSILSFLTGSQFPLYYKINDAEWALASPESRTLKLVSLSPGDYHIRFRLGDGIFPQQEIRFTINKPWWLRAWFLLLCVLLFVAAAYLYFRWRIDVMKRQNKLIQEKMELEKNLNKSMLASIKAQMNPHFFYNALNTIQAFIFSDDKKNASNYLTKFSKLTRMILEFSEKEHITLNEEISALTLYLEIEKVRFNDDFEFHIHVGPEVNTDLIRIPSMLIQPYVENAVKHGLLHKKEYKVLTLSFSCSANLLRVVIDDNGIGRKRSEELNHIRKNKHEAFATSANQTRLNILNKDKQQQTAVDYIDKTDQQNNPAGTTVIITVPVKY